MLITKYIDYYQNRIIQENVRSAKQLLRKIALDKLKFDNPDIDINLSDLDNKARTGSIDSSVMNTLRRESDENPRFLIIKDLLKNNPSLTYAFVKFHFQENIPFDSLKLLYDRLLDLKKSGIAWSTIDNADGESPMNFDKYVEMNSGFEELSDDVTELETKRSVDRFIRNLPGNFVVKNPMAADKGVRVSSFRTASRTATKEQKEEIKNIAIAFDEIGSDLKERDALHRLFYLSCYRYRSLNELLTKAKEYINSSLNRNIVDLLLNIDRANSEFGILNGAEVVYNSGNIVIFEVKSFQANVLLNSSTKHCIKDDYSHWENYVSGENVYNKQYYLWDFNLPATDNKSIIGITISPEYRVRAAHYKDDRLVTDVKKYVGSLGIDFEAYFQPMNQSEIKTKIQRTEANKDIQEIGLTLNDAERVIEQGADPNIDRGKPLLNAVIKDDVEVASYLISKGARTNLNSPIKFAKSFEMISLLVKNGAEIQSGTLDNCINDAKAIKFLLNNGLDPNANKGSAIISAIKRGSKDAIKLFIKYGARFHHRNWMALRYAVSLGNFEIIDIIFDHISKSGSSNELTQTDIDEIIWNLEMNNNLKNIFTDKSEKELDDLKELLKSHVLSKYENLKK